ncbi:MAG TPA: outer membrane beta-barrel protein [Kofleriaceae bacterium]|nr:outer membrane beta-barrel protein [Kofleriaceae bacterium]
MRSRSLAAVAVALTAGAAGPARADIGMYEEGGLGTARASGGLEPFADGGFSGRGALGYRGAHVGVELAFATSELTLRDDDGTFEGSYTALTVGPMATGRVVLTRTMLDKHFARWLELYGKVGPTHTWMYGDPGDGPPDGTRGFGFAAGGGIRWVYAAVGFSFDITYVRARLHEERVHDPRDELGVMDEPAVDLRGNVIATTLGFGFVL